MGDKTRKYLYLGYLRNRITCISSGGRGITKALGEDGLYLGLISTVVGSFEEAAFASSFSNGATNSLFACWLDEDFEGTFTCVDFPS